MKSQPENFATGPSRRDFIKTAAQTTAVVAGVDFLDPIVYARGRVRKVAIVSDPKDSLAGEQPVRWAVEQLQDHLKAKSVSVELH
ncbi:MAG: twin-arginine translocation signal domain-containing protein, partial [Planctomycetota bacterium]